MPVENFNPMATEYVLRRKGIGRMRGEFRTIASNDRYELLVPVDRSSLALIWFNAGFLPSEGPAGHEWRWLIHHGHVMGVSGRPQRVTLQSNLEVNPVLGGTRLDVTLNSREIERIEIKDLQLPLNAGVNTISFYGLKPGAPIPGVEGRLVGVRFWTPKVELLR